MNLQMYISIVLLLTTFTLKSQNLYVDKYEDISLSDGLEIRVHKKWGLTDTNNQYYYIPVNLQFSTARNNEPEFSFMAYKDGETTVGAIMHFLITWGLTKNQLNEAQDSLRVIKGEDAKLMGGVLPEVVDPDIGFTIEGKSSLVQILNEAKVSIGKTPSMPHSKIAASFQLNKEDAEIFQKALSGQNDELKNISISILYILNFKKTGTRMNCKKDHKIKNNFYELLNQIL